VLNGDKLRITLGAGTIFSNGVGAIEVSPGTEVIKATWSDTDGNNSSDSQ